MNQNELIIRLDKEEYDLVARAAMIEHGGDTERYAHDVLVIDAMLALSGHNNEVQPYN